MYCGTLWIKFKFYLIPQISRPVNIAAGLIGALQDEDDETIYLGHIYPQPVDEIPIPHTWWILIYDNNKENGVVIMMVNKPYNPNMDGIFYDENYCNVEICTASNVIDALPDRREHPYYIYCCRPYAITGEYDITGQNHLLELPDLVTRRGWFW